MLDTFNTYKCIYHAEIEKIGNECCVFTSSARTFFRQKKSEFE